MRWSNGRTRCAIGCKRAAREELRFDVPVDGRVRNLVGTRTWSPGRVLFGARDRGDRRLGCPNARARPTRARLRQTHEARPECRHGRARAARERSWPPRSTNATSIANRMKNVWMLLHGARIKRRVARPGAIGRAGPGCELRESNAVSIVRATTRVVAGIPKDPVAQIGRRSRRKDAAVQAGLRDSRRTPRDSRWRRWRRTAVRLRPV